MEEVNQVGKIYLRKTARDVDTTFIHPRKKLKIN